MRRFAFFVVLAGMLLASVNAPCLAQDFKPYPGSKLDEKASRDASAALPDKKSEVYTTDDAFDKVYAFYKGLYKEYTMPGPARKASSGLRWAFFLLDGEKDLGSSKYWMKVQRPFISGAGNKDIRDITVIQTIRAK